MMKNKGFQRISSKYSTRFPQLFTGFHSVLKTNESLINKRFQETYPQKASKYNPDKAVENLPV